MQIEYVKGNAYFSFLKHKIKPYAYLDKPFSCDVLVIGGGIDGAITLYYLAKAGFDCALIEKHRLGLGCTSVATALLEYQLDDHAKQLKKTMNEDEVMACYTLNLNGLKMLKQFVSEYGNDCSYNERDTALFSLEEKDLAEIEEEYHFRKAHHLPVKLLTSHNNPFSFKLKAGLLAENGGAEVNPYLLEKQLLMEAEKLGAKIFENTEAMQLIYEHKVKVLTNYQIPIICNKIICATGYDTALFTSKKLCDKFVSYSIVTNHLPGFSWHHNALLQDNSDPYHYIRMLPDDRIILGGEDTPFVGSKINDKTARKKYDLLYDYLIQLFPELKNKAKADFEFCGCFSATLNNVGLVGQDKDNPQILYNLGYGANGIVNSFVGADIICKFFTR